MLTESFIAATEAVNKPSAHLSSSLKDVGIFQYEFQPQNTLRHGYKKTSVKPNCLAVSKSHIYAAQANKAVIHVYNRDKGNQEATIPFPDKIHSLAYAHEVGVLAIGVEDGKLILWGTATGAISNSAAAHLEAVSSLAVTKNNEYIISGSKDSSLHVWSMAQLITFSYPSQSYNDTAPKDAPLRTFSHHRAGVTALAVGHSNSSTNFAVSASADLTCYLWHIETCQILRTFLMISVPISISLDPGDRAIYFGNEDGSILNVELFGESQNSRRSIYDATDLAPIQLTESDRWSAPSSNVGSATCLTLSYDGTSLLSGHVGGTIIRWDVAKHRVVSEVANTYQPVNSLLMLRPEGLQHEDRNFLLPIVVKPRLELNAESIDNTVGLPASYSLTAQVLQNSKDCNAARDVDAVLNGGLFRDSMLSDALQAMNAKSAGISDPGLAGVTSSNKNDMYKIQALEDEKRVLEKKLAAVSKMYNDAQDRHQKRSERREQIGQRRREAYFAAKTKGQDGDEAMKAFQDRLEAIDVESDEEELKGGDIMDIEI